MRPFATQLNQALASQRMNKIVYLILIQLLLFSINVEAQESICYGTTKNGSLKNGVKLPSSGVNFTSYGNLPELSGRTYVHSVVKNIVIESYKKLYKTNPNKKYKYAESGFKNGGKFRPHKTHQNGLSIDFMVPVLDKNNKSVYFPTNPFNKYGYNVNFDANGINENYKIDFDAIGAHIVALNEAAINNGVGIWRVIFAPELQGKLYATKYGKYIKKNIKIPTKKSWVRHDEHYHVDFKIKCKPEN